MSRGPKPMVSDRKLLDLVANCEEEFGRPVATAKDISNRVGLSRQNVHRRLQNLKEEGELNKYKPGRSVVWWKD